MHHETGGDAVAGLARIAAEWLQVVEERSKKGLEGEAAGKWQSGAGWIAADSQVAVLYGLRFYGSTDLICRGVGHFAGLNYCRER
jgi:hypothetical protein